MNPINAGYIYTGLDFRTDKALRDTDRAIQAVKNVDRAVDTSSRRSSRSWLSFSGTVERGGARAQAGFSAVGRGAQTMGTLLKGALATSVILVFIAALAQLPGVLTGAINNAADLGESLSRNEVLFGRQAGAVEDFSRRTSTSLGLAQKDTLNYAGGLGNLFKNVGLTEKASASYAQTLITRSADVASFSNAVGGTAGVLQDLQSAFAGETEPLRKYGVFLSADAIQAEALSSGLAKANVNMAAVRKAQLASEGAQRAYNAAVKEHGANSLEARKAQNALELAQQGVTKALAGSKVELTDQQEVQATYQLFLRQTASAQGDFARTSAGLPNQLRILKAQLVDLSTATGQGLLPVATAVVTQLNRFIPVLRALPGEVRTVSREFGTGFRQTFVLSEESRSALARLRSGVADFAGGARAALSGDFLPSARETGRTIGSILSQTINLATAGPRHVRTYAAEIGGVVDTVEGHARSIEIAVAAIRYAWEGDAVFASEGVGMLSGRLQTATRHLIAVALRGGEAGRSLRADLAGGVTASSRALDTLVTSTQSRVPVATAAVRGYGGAVRESLGANTQQAVERSQGLLQRLGGSAKTWLTGTAVPALQAAGGAASDFYNRNLRPAVDGAIGFLQGLGRAAAPALADFRSGFEDLKPAISVVGAFLRGVLRGALNAVLPILQLGATIIGTVLVTALQAGALAFRGIAFVIGFVARKLQPFLPQVERVGEVVGFVFGSVIFNAVTGGIGVIGRLVTTFGSVPRAIAPVLSRAQGLWRFFGQFFPGLAGHVSRAAVYLRDLAGNLLNPYTVGQRAFGLLQDVIFGAVRFIGTRLGVLVSGFRGAFSSGPAGVLGVIGKAIGNIQGLPGVLFRAGVNILNGLTEGIRSRGKALLDQVVTTVTSGLPDFIKARLGIASPSTVMRGFGVNLLEGLIGGIASMGRDLLDSARSVITDAVPDFIRDKFGIDATGARVFFDIATKMVGGLVNGLVNRARLLINNVKAVMAVGPLDYLRIKFGITSTGATAFFEIAQKLIGGLINGLGARARELITSVGSAIVSGPMNFIREKFGLTPTGGSQVFFGFAASLMTGLIRGIGDKAGGLRDALSGALKGAVNAGISQLNNGISAAQSFANKFGDAINWLADKLGAGTVVPRLEIPRIPQYARGTKHHPGGYALVGEEGPELVRLPRGAAVMTADETRRAVRDAVGADDVRRTGQVADTVEGPGRPWPGGVIPYYFAPGFSGRDRVLAAMSQISRSTGIKFDPRGETRTLEDWAAVRIRGTGSGYYATVGKQDSNYVNLAPGFSTGIAIHELAHITGLWHEQMRADRDRYVRILWDNIQSGQTHNFAKLPGFRDYGPYDYRSIMHYNPYAFSRNGNPTIVPLQPGAQITGQRGGLSSLDAAGIRALYPGGAQNLPESGGGGGITDMLGNLFGMGADKALDFALDRFGVKLALPGILGQLAGPTLGKVKDIALAYVRKLMDGGPDPDPDPVTGPYTRDRASGWVQQALRLTRNPASWLGGMLDIIAAESSYNPRAQNPTSSAAGLGQIIRATWGAYAPGQYRDFDRWKFEAVPNASTMARYIAGRYGTIGNALAFRRRHNYYADGGLIREPVLGYGLRSGQSYSFAETGIEAVLNPAQVRALTQVRERVIEDRDGSREYHFHYHGIEREDLRREMERGVVRIERRLAAAL